MASSSLSTLAVIVPKRVDVQASEESRRGQRSPASRVTDRCILWTRGPEAHRPLRLADLPFQKRIVCQGHRDHRVGHVWHGCQISIVGTHGVDVRAHIHGQRVRRTEAARDVLDVRVAGICIDAISSSAGA